MRRALQGCALAFALALGWPKAGEAGLLGADLGKSAEATAWMAALDAGWEGIAEATILTPPQSASPNCGAEESGVTHALLVGAENPAGMVMAEIPNDIVLARDVLAARGVRRDRITTLTGETATLEQLRGALEALSEAVGCGDSVVLYFAAATLPRSELFPVLGSELPRLSTVFEQVADDNFILEESRQRLRVLALSAPYLWLNPSEPDRMAGVSALALANLVTVFRSRGADVTLVLDTDHAAGFEVETWQELAGERARWREVVARSSHGVPDYAIPREPDVLRLAPGGGALTVLYGTDVGQLAPGTLQIGPEDGTALPYSEFGFRLAMALQTAVRTTPPVLLRSFREVIPDGESVGGTVIFVASDPEAEIVAELRPSLEQVRHPPPMPTTGAPAQGGIRITDPAPTRGAAVMESPRVTLRGVVEHPEAVLQVVVNGAFARREDGRRFAHDLELAPGANRINVVAVLQGGGVLVHETEIFLEGDAASLIGDGTRYAVMIANQNYRPGSGIPSLANPIGDGEAIAAVLRDRYGFVTETAGADGGPLNLMLHDPSRAEIEDILWEVGRIAGARDTVLIFYAGHGVYEAATGSAFWQPADARADRPQSWLSATAITEALMRMEAGNILLISDSCYSGMLSRSGEAGGQPAAGEERLRALQRLAERRSRILISSGANEPVYDGGGDGHSVFARALLDGLTRNEAPIFAAQELFADWLRPQVLGLVGQEPQFRPVERSGHEGGDVVFACVIC